MQARQRSTVPDRVGLASEAALHGADWQRPNRSCTRRRPRPRFGSAPIASPEVHDVRTSTLRSRRHHEVFEDEDDDEDEYDCDGSTHRDSRWYSFLKGARHVR
jgi:hypothetical protein